MSTEQQQDVRKPHQHPPEGQCASPINIKGLTIEEFEELKALAKQSDRTVSSYIRQLIRSAIVRSVRL
jgi:hypothetical protein